MNRNNDYVENYNHIISQLAEWAIKYRVILSGIFIVIFIAGVILTFRNHIDNSFKTFFLDDDTSFSYYREFLQEYSNDEYIYIVYQYARFARN